MATILSSLLVAALAVATVREIAPIFTALALTARNGTAIASELAHMNISNQVDAIPPLPCTSNETCALTPMESAIPEISKKNLFIVL